ncbi:hypothetical protein GS399_04945 [Pedobacter sp. HMF7647]|uniref:Histidine kinase domain-containing protein n=1 Tax=Hufsiella arboris TaxID=2695275 RepID=A0A7K1Y791_9SPHI|nr:sensor histidine kinase [Hufsiella arboris]MXV50310.1 hypothetical protein [Hufsiella arboris]
MPLNALFIIPRLFLRIIFISGLAQLLIVYNGSGQIAGLLRFKAYTINDGLSQGYISSILQDRQGLLWFATADGLNKFDGYRFTVYHHDADDANSIGSDDIACIFEDSGNRLWIGTRHSGLDVFDRKRGIFGHINAGLNGLSSNDILAISEDRSGALWIRSREGIDRMEIMEGPPNGEAKASVASSFGFALRFTPVKLRLTVKAEEYQAEPPAVFIDSRGHVYLLTNSRIVEVYFKDKSRNLGIRERYRFTSADSTVIPEMIEDTLTHSYFVNNKSVIHFPSYDFSRPKALYRSNSAFLRWVNRGNGALWILDQSKVVSVNSRNGRTRVFGAIDPAQDRFLQTATVFFKDRTGVVWIGSGGYGILKYDPEAEQFHHILSGLSHYQLLTLPSGEIITNNYQSITLGDNGPVIEDFISQGLIRKKFPKFLPLSFSRDTWGNLWYGINGGIIRYNIRDKSATRYDLPFAGTRVLPFPLYADRENTIWMGYGSFFVSFDPFSGKFKRHSYQQSQQSVDYDFLQCIYQDENLLWLGTTSGLLCFDMREQRIIDYFFNKPYDKRSVSNSFILTLCNDAVQPNRYLWVGTKGGGLNRLDKKTGSFIHFTTKDGLPNNVVYGLQFDRKGRLWMSTNKGISGFNTSDKQFRNYDVADGLQSNEFNRYAFCKTPAGMMVFGGLNGINYFDPDKLSPLKPPPVVFTDFRLFNKPVPAGRPGDILANEIGWVRQLKLRYAQNVITFQFAATDYRKPGSIRYRYMMEGFDENYIYSGVAREATYTNLDPGKYTFLVQASFEDGVWGTGHARIGVLIVPPWWKTWWFYLLVVTTVFSATYLIYRERLMQLARLNKLRNRIARDLHDEVGSSISTIAIYSRIVQDHMANSKVTDQSLMEKITEFATEVMESMSDIVWNIHAKNDSFDSVVSRMREHAYELFEAKGYTINFSFDEQLQRLRLSMEKRRDFYLIYKEALNNIAKYAGGSNVWISLYVQNNVITLSIKDDGRGFDAVNARKGGNGLQNMKHRADTLKGRITISSQPGKGTELVLRFPAA